MILQALLLTVLVLATSVWAGGYGALGIVAHTAAATLDPSAGVMLFRCRAQHPTRPPVTDRVSHPLRSVKFILD